MAKEQISYGFKHCQILKISDDELLWFTEETDFDRAVKRLQQEYGIALILLLWVKMEVQHIVETKSCGAWLL